MISENKNNSSKPYRCVACGAGALALTRSYGPSVLKLSTCERCGGVVDKYVEYDPVIVVIDLVLVTREAQRHILHNTKFKVFWKLLVVLAILETYGMWCGKHIINLTIETLCARSWFGDLNSTIWVSDGFRHSCLSWQNEVKLDDADPFILENTFYIDFVSVFSGTVVFTTVIYTLSKVLAKILSTGTNASIVCLMKAVAVGNMANLFTLPLLIWGMAHEGAKHIHILLVFSYTFLVFLNVLIVTYNFNMVATVCITALAYLSKFAAVYTSKQLIHSFI